jgi:hypothetical protein
MSKPVPVVIWSLPAPPMIRLSPVSALIVSSPPVAGSIDFATRILFGAWSLDDHWTEALSPNARFVPGPSSM